jgi:hypothetical protein
LSAAAGDPYIEFITHSSRVGGVLAGHLPNALGDGGNYKPPGWISMIIQPGGSGLGAGG